MCREQPHGREANPSVPYGETIKPYRTLEPRETRHQQELYEYHVGPEQCGKLSGGGECTARSLCGAELPVP